jgi:hypothetical protein
MDQLQQPHVEPAPACSTPKAIQACVAALAAEAFESGHTRAARLLAQMAALLDQPALWQRTAARE